MSLEDTTLTALHCVCFWVLPTSLSLVATVGHNEPALKDEGLITYFLFNFLHFNINGQFKE